jgi:trypsin
VKSLRVKAVLMAFCAMTVASCGEQAGQQKSGGRATDAATTSAENSDNWMRTYIDLRVYAANAKFGNTPGATTKIVGGEPAGPNDNPFQVALLNKTVSDNYSAQFCGGTIIAPNVIVTAAHCSDFTTAPQVQVLTGARSLKTGGTRRDVTKIVIHPKWNAQNNDYDVAVWHLATQATGPFATLGTADGATGSSLLATGWGKLSQGGNSPTDLYRVSLPVADRSDCNDANSYNGAISNRMLCAGKAGGGIDTCQGDSGGPLTRNSELVGITSWGRGCAMANFYGIYARVSDTEIRNFIQSND